ncbi:MAG: sigma-70 family RNA polymerase sigma factor [Firmicutes bacterium]|nr:sigma-70 family RNA polymerase sigma factor [Bacillota bacterium]
MTDLEIIQLCHKKRPEGFARLLLAYQELVYRQAYSFLRHREDALDITQDVFLRAFQAIDRFEAGRPIKPWLKRITLNLCLNFIRDRPALSSLDDTFGDEMGKTMADTLAATSDVPGEVEGLWMREALDEALQELPPLHRIVVLLRHQEDLTYEEIAQRLDLPLGTVKTYLFRARKYIRSRLAGLLMAEE